MRQWQPDQLRSGGRVYPPCALIADRRRAPFGKRHAAVVLERMHEPVDREGVGERGNRRVERRRVREALSADRAIRRRQRAHRTRGTEARQGARATIA